MKNRASLISGFSLLIAALLITLSVNLNAQERVHKNVKVKKEVVVKHNNEYREIVVKDRHCFYRGGYFYDRGSNGYVKITAPMGARINILPRGYKVVRVHRLRYYLFGDVYYRFLPREKVYVVVEAPL